MEVENRITLDRYQEMKIKNDELNQEINFTKLRHSETISNLESKINQVRESYEVVRIENKTIKSSDDKLKYELSAVKLERDNFEEKYIKTKQAKEDYAKKASQFEFQIKALIMEKDMIINDKRRQEEERRIKNEMKSQCIEQMRNHIHSFKSELMRSRSKNK